MSDKERVQELLALFERKAQLQAEGTPLFSNQAAIAFLKPLYDANGKLKSAETLEREGVLRPKDVQE